MARLVSVPTSPTEGSEAATYREGSLEEMIAAYHDWQEGATDSVAPRHDSLVLFDDFGVPLCAGS